MPKAASCFWLPCRPINIIDGFHGLAAAVSSIMMAAMVDVAWSLGVYPQHNANVPDGLHMPMLIYRRLLRGSAGDALAREVTRRDAATSPYQWALCPLSVVPAVPCWSHPWLQVSLVPYGSLCLFFILGAIDAVSRPQRVAAAHR